MPRRGALGEDTAFPLSGGDSGMTEGVDFQKEGLGPQDLREARPRVAKNARVTPLLVSEELSERFGHKVAYKCESLQTGGAFKMRGATNFIARLSQAGRERGVLTYSSGNHGIAVALAARRAGVKAVVVMPETAPLLKLERVRSLGAELHRVGTTSIERKERAEGRRATRKSGGSPAAATPAAPNRPTASKRYTPPKKRKPTSRR